MQLWYSTKQIQARASNIDIQKFMSSFIILLMISMQKLRCLFYKKGKIGKRLK